MYQSLRGLIHMNVDPWYTWILPYVSVLTQSWQWWWYHPERICEAIKRKEKWWNEKVNPNVWLVVCIWEYFPALRTLFWWKSAIGPVGGTLKPEVDHRHRKTIFARDASRLYVVNAAFPLSFPPKRDKQNSSGSVSSPPPPHRWSNHARDIVWLGVSLGVFSLRMMRLRVVVVSVPLGMCGTGDVVCAVAKLTLSGLQRW